jgi:hypothetical protein
MTPAEEAEFIALWQRGASYREIAVPEANLATTDSVG